MICLKCKYYIPLIARSYDLSKCLKLGIFVKPSLTRCNGYLFIESKHNNLSSLVEIKNKDKR